MKDNTRELQVAATSALLEAAAQDPERFASLYNDRLSWLRILLLHTDGTGAIHGLGKCAGGAVTWYTQGTCAVNLCCQAKLGVQLGTNDGLLGDLRLC